MGDTSQPLSKNTDQKETASRSKTKKRDRSASEERLLQAAEDIFAKHGFNGATTRMIADKAKVNESLIGRYFDGKMGLLLAVCETHIKDKVQQDALMYPAQATVHEELTSLVDSMFEHHCKKDEEFFKIVLGQCLVDAKFLKRIREIAPISLYINQVIERLEVLRTEGKVKKDVDLRQAMEIFDTYFHGSMFFDRILLGTDVESIQAKLKIFITGLAESLSTGK
ncbi:TetR/AcrR family transcriptional regulator [Bdellovibrio sp. KM01]|uniref:TetR/AcrR family transcriptional regulator n=1 Tax=Bdellovibrio sp. KM01 TaxID=2748865 RepID=UPI0015E9000D|nr:TetR/AcrR family transcriptional regulator [Bdellovibrio sp. KM01]QLY26136.1 TetR/AcrR family transcriptional regulator [Bdellovibrio sp. KM01]